MPLKADIPKTQRLKYQRPDGRFTRRIDGKDFYAYSRKELDEQIFDYNMQKKSGIKLDDDTTIDQWFKIWIKNYKGDLRKNTIAMYNSIYNPRIKPFIGSMGLKEVMPINVMEVLNLCRGKSDSLQMKTLITMSQLFQTAQENKLITSNPCIGIKIKKQQREEKVKTLTAIEQAKILEVSELTRANMFVALGLYCGLRREESLGLTWGDINWENKRVKIQRTVIFGNNQSEIELFTKSAAGRREIPIPPPLYKILENSNPNHKDKGLTKAQYVVDTGYEIRETVSKYLCPSSTGGIMSKSSFKRMWEVVTKRVDFKVTSHMLRHTYCTGLHKAGIDMRTAQYLLGDSDMRTVAKIYTHIENDQIENASKAITKMYENKDNSVTNQSPIQE